MTTLTDAQATEMVRLRIEEGLTRDQIAGRLGVPVYRVKRRWGEIPPEHRQRSGSAFVIGEDLVQEMIRLRTDERLTQRQIAKRMGLNLHLIKRVWHRLPDRLRDFLPESRQRSAETRRANRARAVGSEKCVRCEFIFDEENPESDGGECVLCSLQRQGLVVLYCAA